MILPSHDHDRPPQPPPSSDLALAAYKAVALDLVDLAFALDGLPVRVETTVGRLGSDPLDLRGQLARLRKEQEPEAQRRRTYPRPVPDLALEVLRARRTDWLDAPAVAAAIADVVGFEVPSPSVSAALSVLYRREPSPVERRRTGHVMSYRALGDGATLAFEPPVEPAAE